jgi:3-dehydroquinate dehydratase II
VRIAVLNGPNLNLLGTREPELYGRETLSDVEHRLRRVAGELQVDIEFTQKNSEGDLIEVVHAMRDRVDGALVNAGAYTHSSLALRDAFVGCAVPFVEVHITNIYAREPERRHSMLSSAAVGMVCGLGVLGYELALRGLVSRLTADD